MHGFFHHLRERKLVQWALAYLAGAWLVLQVFGELRESFGWNPAAGRVVIVLLVLGLFIALVLAWYHGEQGRQRVSGPELVMLATLFAIAGGVAWMAGREGGPPPTPAAAGVTASLLPPPAPGRSIAVLPFTNLSESRENEYFSDGITEDVLTNLSKVGGLRVLSRTSTMAYRGTSKPLRQIGRELGVSHVVEGSVRRAGDRVRITAQLIDARTDAHVWAQSYDRDLEDVFRIQSEIAREIAGALQVQLTRGERERIAAAPTSSLTAYDYYLQGRQYFDRLTDADIQRSIPLFERAIALDPGYALALAWLGRALLGASPLHADSAEVLMRRAVARDPDRPDGYTALGELYRLQGRLSLALQQYQRAVALNPSDATAIAETGQTYVDMGRMDEGIPWLKRGISLDPRAIWPYAILGSAYELLGDLDEAGRWYRRGLELRPDFVYIHMLLAYYYQQRGDPSRAYEAARTAASLDSAHLRTVAQIELLRGNLPAALEHYERGATSRGWNSIGVTQGYVYWKLGRREKADSVFRRGERYARQELAKGSELWVPYWSLAIVHATRGQREQALRELEQAAAHGFRDRWTLSTHPPFQELRSDPRFQQIAARIQADVDRQRLRVQREGI